MNHAGKKAVETTFLDQMEQVNFADLVQMILVNKWLIVSSMFCCLCVCIVYLMFTKPVYTANVLLQVGSHSSSLEQMGKMEGGVLGSGGAASPAAVQTALIKSRVVLAPAVEKLGLNLSVTPDYFPLFGKAYANGHTNELAKPFLGWSRFAWGGEKITVDEFITPVSGKNQKYILVALPRGKYALYSANGRFILKGNVGQKANAFLPGAGEFTLMVSTLTANPNTHFFLVKKPMQAFIENLAKNLQINDLSTANDLNVGNTGILQLRLDGGDPEYIVSALNIIAQVTVEKDAAKKAMEATQTLAFINKEIPVVKQSLDGAESALNDYLVSHHMLDLNTQSKILLTELTETAKNLALVRMARTQALQEYTSEHPYVIGLNEKEKMLQAELSTLQEKASQLPAQDREVVQIMRDVRLKSQLYLILLHQAQSLEVSRAGTVSDVLILDWAHLPDGPIPVEKMEIILGGLIAGFVLGVLIILARNMVHQKISDPMTIEDQFGVPNMAIIPYSNKQDWLYATHRAKENIVPILAQLDPKDLSIEALRSFRTSLQFSMLDAVNNIITIMGVAPAVGKSFISSNFAYLLADAGKKILLIDGDLRKGHLGG